MRELVAELEDGAGFDVHALGRGDALILVRGEGVAGGARALERDGLVADEVLAHGADGDVILDPVVDDHALPVVVGMSNEGAGEVRDERGRFAD